MWVTFLVERKPLRNHCGAMPRLWCSACLFRLFFSRCRSPPPLLSSILTPNGTRKLCVFSGRFLSLLLLFLWISDVEKHDEAGAFRSSKKEREKETRSKRGARRKDTKKRGGREGKGGRLNSVKGVRQSLVTKWNEDQTRIYTPRIWRESLADKTRGQVLLQATTWEC